LGTGQARDEEHDCGVRNGSFHALVNLKLPGPHRGVAENKDNKITIPSISLANALPGSGYSYPASARERTGGTVGSEIQAQTQLEEAAGIRG
jgi:hypothetical protein